MLLRSSALVAAIAAISLLAPPPSAFGQASGTWTSTVDGAWSNNANWSGGVIASGANNTANFNTLDITDQSGVTGAAAVRVDFDGPRTLGHLVFGDTNIATPGVWEITTVDPLTNRLTLADAAKPTITVNQLGVVEPTPGSPPVFDDVIIRPNLAGTQGFDKLGAGIASVTSTYDATTAANNLTGVVNVGAGTLRILAGSTFDTETAITPAVTSFTVGSGAVLAPAAGIRNITMGANSTISASANVSYITAAGGSVISTSAGGIGIGGSAAGDANSGVAITGGGSIIINSSATGVTSIAGVSGAGATATLNLSAGLVRFDRDWDRTGALAVLNLNGTNTDGVTKTGIQLRPNGGAWDGNGLLNTTVTLDRVVLNTNQSTGGNTIGIGALNGTATAELIASGGGVGATTYNVGALNTNAVFNGSIGLNAGAGGRSLVIVKQGTGTWELTGALTYTPQPELSNINRRGGITRVEAGTLKVSGTARLPGGNPESNHAVVGVGDLFSTVDIRAGATLDVSASTGTYSSVALQQTIGRGTIAGTYNHAAGILAPGDTVTGGNTASLIGTAGTMTFANTLTFAGAGQVNFDISPSLTTGNDLLQVGGADLNGTPTIKLGFLGGATSGAYTLINSNTPLVGTTAGWNVLWEGRGAAPTLTQTANQVKVNVSFAAAGMLNWAGSVDGVWNAGAAGTANWHNTTSNAADKFFQLDNVAFRDTSNGVTPPATTAITLNSTVSPAAVLIDSSLNYTISGTGRITGGGSLTKQGSGTATVTTANDYTGGTTIAGGVLNRDANGSFGSGQITFAGGELQSRGWTSLNAISVPAGVTAKIRNLGATLASPVTPGDVGIANINLDAPISGSGTLEFLNDTLTTDVNLVQVPQVQALDLRANNSGFTGTIRFSGAGRYAARVTVQRAAPANVAWDLGNSSLGPVLNTFSVIPLGSLTGGPNSSISGHSSGGGAGTTVYEIGGLNTSTTYQGNIIDGRTDLNPISTTSIVKVGTGTLTLTDPVDVNDVNGLAPEPVYTGFTKILGGTLSIQTPYLADGSDVYIASGAVFDLNTGVGTIDVIDSLILNNVPMAPGTYGAPGSGASFTSTFFSGTGQLQVTTLGVAPVAGDFDGNGTVQAADLAVLQQSFGYSRGGDLDQDGDTDGNDFVLWQRLGVSPTLAAGGAVPEPAAGLLAALVLPALAAARRRRLA